MICSRYTPLEKTHEPAAQTICIICDGVWNPHHMSDTPAALYALAAPTDFDLSIRYRNNIPRPVIAHRLRKLANLIETIDLDPDRKDVWYPLTKADVLQPSDSGELMLSYH